MYTKDRYSAVTILVVDDEPMITRWISAVLEARGYRVCAALNFGEYTSFAADQSFVPEVIIFDLQFGAHNGATLWQAHQEVFPKAVWIPCSGYIAPSLLDTMGLHRSDVLQKPFSGARLLEVIERGLHRRTSQKQAACQ